MTLRTPTRRWAAHGAAAVALLAMAGGTPTAASAAPARPTGALLAMARSALARSAPGRPADFGGNPYSPAYGHPYRRGVMPTRATATLMGRWAAQHPGAAVAPAGADRNLSYGGAVDGIGVTTGRERVYLVFFGKQWGKRTRRKGDLTLSGDPSGEAPYLQRMFKGLGTGGETWSGVMTQYCERIRADAAHCPANAPHVAYPHYGALAGVWVDESAVIPTGQNVYTAFDLGTEAVRAAAHFGNTTPAANRDAQYVIASPTGTDPDNWLQDSFCAWHDYNGDPYVGASSPYGDIAFTNLPYVTDLGRSCGADFVNGGKGPLDGVSIVEGHEYAETITDQNPAGGWTDSSGAENGDKCAWKPPGTPGGAGDLTLPTGVFAMQSTWSNDAQRGRGACEFTHPVVGAQLLKSPGFESGRAAWTATRGVITRKSAACPAHSGRWLARLDGRGRPHTDTLAQKVTVPPAYGAAAFSFWLEVRSNAARRRAADRLTVQVLDVNGKVLKTLHVYSNRDKRNRYHEHSFSLASLLQPPGSSAGTTLAIRFTGRERLRRHDTAFCVDDAALTVS